ncbi:reverse transcriptase [Gossypium australe]|uniref:Reverse transcriptase n=1 Tax=Gossypium australe TaxID=47621 RepID=A0A5B6WDF0_9ROSI|nr:reverse transcriptase [Gossypium australe]
MRCVETISYSVVLNGQIGESFFPTRGLRQGDPLRLSTLLQLTSIKGTLKGARVNRHVPLITYLLFAYESLIFSEAMMEGARALKDILKIYANSSRVSVFQILGVTSSNNPGRYLGLPSIMGKNKRLTFKEIKEKMSKKGG